MNNKPPLGVKPKFIHEEHRIIELLGGIYRYTKFGLIEDHKNTMFMWGQELVDLIINYERHYPCKEQSNKSIQDIKS